MFQLRSQSLSQCRHFLWGQMTDHWMDEWASKKVCKWEPSDSDDNHKTETGIYSMFSQTIDSVRAKNPIPLPLTLNPNQPHPNTQNESMISFETQESCKGGRVGVINPLCWQRTVNPNRNCPRSSNWGAYSRKAKVFSMVWEAWEVRGLASCSRVSLTFESFGILLKYRLWLSRPGTGSEILNF